MQNIGSEKFSVMIEDWILRLYNIHFRSSRTLFPSIMIDWLSDWLIILCFCRIGNISAMERRRLCKNDRLWNCKVSLLQKKAWLKRIRWYRFLYSKLFKIDNANQDHTRLTKCDHIWVFRYHDISRIWEHWITCFSLQISLLWWPYLDLGKNTRFSVPFTCHTYKLNGRYSEKDSKIRGPISQQV